MGRRWGWVLSGKFANGVRMGERLHSFKDILNLHATRPLACGYNITPPRRKSPFWGDVRRRIYAPSIIEWKRPYSTCPERSPLRNTPPSRSHRSQDPMTMYE